jgi:hypothetical protein
MKLQSNKNSNLFFGHYLLSLPSYGTTCYAFLIPKTANESTNECNHLSIKLFVPFNEEIDNKMFKKLRQPDLPDNTGKS